jgi:hypothetical protein
MDGGCLICFVVYVLGGGMVEFALLTDGYRLGLSDFLREKVVQRLREEEEKERR